jgi:hypothetical protein
MTIKDMTILFRGSFQLCELCSYIVLFKRFVIDPILLALHAAFLEIKMFREGPFSLFYECV